ncbi:LuxR C-terminal-related transcriptional regulator [Streptomyces sp. NPDC059340]|uniref:LuxR C-terminal-related transcriptional regulator n=1 Tax=Streptomyces sp. NPDC059340 TaxID=3346806 RepID=UPI0036C4F57E
MLSRPGRFTSGANREHQASRPCNPATRRTAACHRLSPQQYEIARLAAAGMTNKQIGQRLHLSPADNALSFGGVEELSEGGFLNRGP